MRNCYIRVRHNGNGSLTITGFKKKDFIFEVIPEEDYINERVDDICKWGYQFYLSAGSPESCSELLNKLNGLDPEAGKEQIKEIIKSSIS